MVTVQFIPADWFKFWFSNPRCRLTSYAVSINRRVGDRDRRN